MCSLIGSFFQGCYDALTDWLKDNAGYIIGVGVGIIVLEVRQGSHSKWETWKIGKTFSSQGKVREFLTDWKSQGKSTKILEKLWNFRLIIFSDV